MENINLKNIDKLIKEGYISERWHPSAPYRILNYTPKTQYEQMWNEDTMNCRGLILDGEGNIIAKPFKKFFNIGEYNQHNHLGKIPNYTWFDVWDKMDGSLGILYRMPDGEFRIATRGSFESDQAIKATKMFHEMYSQPELIFADNWTYLFEIIYPENRIVVDYGKEEKLVLLAVKSIVDDYEFTYEELLRFANEWEIPLTQYYGRVSYNRHAFLKVEGDILEGNEGFVLKFDNGLRVKVKSEEYTRIHRLVTGLSNKSIWEILRTGTWNCQIETYLEEIPDELYDWIEKTKNKFLVDYKNIEAKAIGVINPLKLKTDRKEIAIEIISKHKKLKGLLFAMLDDKPYEDIIWKMLRPEYSKPFAEEK